MVVMSGMMMSAGMMSMMMMMGMMGNGVLVPALLGKVLALKGALIVAPKIAVGAFIFGQGATLICAQLLWRVMKIRNEVVRRNKLRKQHGKYYHSSKPVTVINTHGWNPPPPHFKPVNPIRVFTSRIKHLLRNKKRPPPRVIFARPNYNPPSSPEWIQSTTETPSWSNINFVSTTGEDLYSPSYNHSVLYEPSEDSFNNHYYNNYNNMLGAAQESKPLEYDDYIKLMSWTKDGGSFEFDSSPTNYEGITDQSYNDGDLDGDDGELSESIQSETLEAAPSTSLPSTLINVVSSTSNSTRIIPITITRIKRESNNIAGSSNKIKQKKKVSSLTKEEAFIQSYLTNDIVDFFKIISSLDEDKCLQKLVCDVHFKAKKDKSKLSAYEQTLINAFKVLNSINAGSKSHIIAKYITAAKFGIKSAKSLSEISSSCTNSYKTCSYTADEVIGFSNQFFTQDSALTTTSTMKPKATTY